MTEKLVNFRMEEDTYQELKMLALKERRPVKVLVSDLIINYVKQHKDGNPQYKLDQFEDPNFIACPAFYSNYQKWLSYYSKATPEELEKLKTHVIMFDKLLGKFL